VQKPDVWGGKVARTNRREKRRAIAELTRKAIESLVTRLEDAASVGGEKKNGESPGSGRSTSHRKEWGGEDRMTAEFLGPQQSERYFWFKTGI